MPGGLPTGHGPSIIKTLLRSVEQLPPETRELLAVISELRPALPVPWEVLVAGRALINAEDDEDIDAAAALQDRRTDREARSLIEPAVNDSLISASAESGVTMHALVGLVVRELATEDAVALAGEACSGVFEGLPAGDQRLDRLLEHGVYYLAGAGGTADPDTARFGRERHLPWLRLRNHAMGRGFDSTAIGLAWQQVHAIERRPAEQTADDPQMWADSDAISWSNLAMCLIEVGDWARAITWGIRAAKYADSRFGETSDRALSDWLTVLIAMASSGDGRFGVSMGELQSRDWSDTQRSDLDAALSPYRFADTGDLFGAMTAFSRLGLEEAHLTRIFLDFTAGAIAQKEALVSFDSILDGQLDDADVHTARVLRALVVGGPTGLDQLRQYRQELLDDAGPQSRRLIDVDRNITALEIQLGLGPGSEWVSIYGGQQVPSSYFAAMGLAERGQHLEAGHLFAAAAGALENSGDKGRISALAAWDRAGYSFNGAENWEEGAEACLKAALGRQSVLPPDREDTWASWANAAYALSKLSRFAEAAEASETAAQGFERVPGIGETHLKTANQWHRAGYCSNEIGDWKRGADASLKAARIRHSLLPPEDEAIWSSWGNAAFALQQLSKYEQAADAYRTAAQGYEQVPDYGPLRPNTLTYWHNAGYCYNEASDYRQGAEACLKAARGRQQTLPPEDDATWSSWVNAAFALQQLSKYEQAADAYRTAAQGYEQVPDYGPLHPETLEHWHNAGLCYDEAGDRAEAAETRHEAALRRRQILGKDVQSTSSR